MKQKLPDDFVGYIWFYRSNFSIRPEIVNIVEEPKGCAQTVYGLIKLEETDWFQLIEEPEPPTTKEAA
jgi:hypothetical protein